MPTIVGGASHDAFKQQMLEQLAEQTKSEAIKVMQTKSVMLLSLMVVALVQLWIGCTALSSNGSSCVLHRWLAWDGAATSIGMLLGLTASAKGIVVARRVEAHQFLRADGKGRDASGDLTGTWQIVEQLSDVLDVVLIVSLLWGCYYYYKTSGGAGDDGSGCDDAGRAVSWVRRGLVLKSLAPTSVTVAIKAWHVMWGASPTIPPQAEMLQRKRK